MEINNNGVLTSEILKENIENGDWFSNGKLTIPADYTSFGKIDFVNEYNNPLYGLEVEIVAEGGQSEKKSLREAITEIDIEGDLKSVSNLKLHGLANLKKFTFHGSFECLLGDFFTFTPIEELEIPRNVKRISAECLGGMENLKKLILHKDLEIDVSDPRYYDEEERIPGIQFIESHPNLTEIVLDKDSASEKFIRKEVARENLRRTSSGKPQIVITTAEPEEIITIQKDDSKEIKESIHEDAEGKVLDPQMLIDGIQNKGWLENGKLTIPADYTSFENIHFGDDETLYDLEIEVNGEKEFIRGLITEIEIQGDVKDCSGLSFAGLEELKTFTIHGSFDSYEADMFAGTAIEKLEIPENVKKISYRTVCDMSELKTLNLHKDLLFDIDEYAWREDFATGCPELKEIIMEEGAKSESYIQERVKVLNQKRTEDNEDPIKITISEGARKNGDITVKDTDAGEENKDKTIVLRKDSDNKIEIKSESSGKKDESEHKSIVLQPDSDNKIEIKPESSGKKDESEHNPSAVQIITDNHPLNLILEPPKSQALKDHLSALRDKGDGDEISNFIAAFDERVSGELKNAKAHAEENNYTLTADDVNNLRGYLNLRIDMIQILKPNLEEEDKTELDKLRNKIAKADEIGFFETLWQIIKNIPLVMFSKNRWNLRHPKLSRQLDNFSDIGSEIKSKDSGLQI